MLDYTKADWTKRASALTFRHQAFIDGKFVDATQFWPILLPAALKM